MEMLTLTLILTLALHLILALITPPTITSPIRSGDICVAIPMPRSACFGGTADYGAAVTEAPGTFGV